MNLLKSAPFSILTTPSYSSRNSDIRIQNFEVNQKSKSNHADLKDYKFEKMKLDYIKKYDSISENDMSGILSFAIYLYHIR